MTNIVYNRIKFKTKKDFDKFKELLITEGEMNFGLLIPISVSTGTEKLDELILPLYVRELGVNTEIEDFINSILQKYVGIEHVLEELAHLGYSTSEEQDSFILNHAKSYYFCTNYDYKGNICDLRKKFWGTGMNASYTDLSYEDENLCTFNTIDSCPLLVFKKLAEMGVNFSCGYHSEDEKDINNHGLVIAKKGELRFVVNKGTHNEKELMAFAMVLDIGSIDCYTEDLYYEYEKNKYEIEYLESCEVYEERMEKLIDKYGVGC